MEGEPLFFWFEDRQNCIFSFLCWNRRKPPTDKSFEIILYTASPNQTQRWMGQISPILRSLLHRWGQNPFRKSHKENEGKASQRSKGIVYTVL